MPQEPNTFGRLLRRACQAQGISRAALATRAGYDPSFIYRIEIGTRIPSRDAVLELADALKIDEQTRNRLLNAAGYAAFPFPCSTRGERRSRGLDREARRPAGSSPGLTAARRARWLTEIGLNEAVLEDLLEALEQADHSTRSGSIRAVRGALAMVTECLQSPLRTVVIPAGGKTPRLLAPHARQQLLLRAISEAVRAGISRIVLVLEPGARETIFDCLSEALKLAVVPVVELIHVEQFSPAGLGDAILQSKGQVKDASFAVILPDDRLREDPGPVTCDGELRRMIARFGQLGGDALLAVAQVPRSKMSIYGVASLVPDKKVPGLLEVRSLVEKPTPKDPIFQENRVAGIVGRYLLSADVFACLADLKKEGRNPLHLTDALEKLRRERHRIYAYPLRAARDDVGEVLDRAAKELKETNPEQVGRNSS